MKDKFIFLITTCFLSFVFILHIEYIDNTNTSGKLVVDIHNISWFWNIKTAVFLAKNSVFLYKNVNYSQLPASNLKLLHESRVNMQNTTTQTWRQIGTRILMTKNGKKCPFVACVWPFWVIKFFLAPGLRSCILHIYTLFIQKFEVKCW